MHDPPQNVPRCDSEDVPGQRDVEIEMRTDRLQDGVEKEHLDRQPRHLGT